jgi:hypothetical protein
MLLLTALPFLHYDNEMIFNKYRAYLRQAGVMLVLTENAVNKCDDKYTFRYIGYLSDNGNNVKIYECINAYSKFKKEILEKTLNIFKKAMGLYYSNDFYLDELKKYRDEVMEKINPVEKYRGTKEYMEQLKFNSKFAEMLEEVMLNMYDLGYKRGKMKI